MAGFRTTVGSRALNASFPLKDSDIVARLRAQGAVIIGKANLDTFAIGGNSSSEVAGQTLNPYGPAVASAGSSSCGNGAGGASGNAVVGVGSDTTGSVLSPSSNQNLIGFNLPWGRLPMRGVFPLSPLLDRAGPLVRYAEDLARVLDVLESRPHAFGKSAAVLCESSGAQPERPAGTANWSAPFGIRDVLHL